MATRLHIEADVLGLEDFETRLKAGFFLPECNAVFATQRVARAPRPYTAPNATRGEHTR
jgi:hypothetical protein